MNSKETLILVSDVRGWAFDNVAQYVQSLLNEQYDCHIIYSCDYKTYKDFLIKLNQYTSIKLIHFFYRGYLTELLRSIADNSSNSKATGGILLNTTITTSIPDHLFIESESEILKNLPTFQFIDNYYTTSKRLYDIYANIIDYPKPWQVIYDNVLIQDAESSQDEDHASLVVTWIGNSSWGSWHSSTPDYKGLKTVIIPALEQLDKDGIHIKRCIVDKNERIRSKQEIWEILKKTDILLIASVQEGTPLTIIEAMAFGCAIITTDVGIAREVLPEVQHEFIINRNHTGFINAIKKLNVERELLAKIKQQNCLSYQEIFANKTQMQNLWYSFIEDSVNNHTKKQILQTKQQILRNIELVNNKNSSFVTYRLLSKILFLPFLKEIARFLLKYSWIKLSVRRIITMFYSFFSKDDYDNFKNFIIKYQGQKQDRCYSRLYGNNIEESRDDIGEVQMPLGQKDIDDIYVIYPSIFPGVANSTKGLFDKIIPFPMGKFNVLISYINSYLPDKVITPIAKLLIKTGIKNLIISGGLDVHIQLVEKLHEMKGDNCLNIYYLWHGSPAQWVGIGHCQTFYKWLNLYKQHKIKSIITLKTGLEQFLIANGVQSYLLQNFIPLHSRFSQCHSSESKNLYPLSVQGDIYDETMLSTLLPMSFPRRRESKDIDQKGALDILDSRRCWNDIVGSKGEIGEVQMPLIETGKFKIGIWSTSNRWIKNLYPQFAAISMFKDRVCCYTNFSFDNNKYASWMMEDVELKVFPENLPHKELIKLMANTNLTLYITNSECSPMIVLESLGLGVPCLVGPTADIYDDEFLRDMLTVNRVDCPLTIFNAVEKVQQNIDIICSKLPDFIKKYNEKALALKNSLLTVIKDNHNTTM
ncbi:glycosyltransferase [Candidatus Tisiphia endosymbiont of Micropterix aruncella]|uniref:glycosyltransferase n=1 Tax=Candidatus Tisiphia endosymbiont of Micropterix aruncella TaxID=3066271 RepID=UPI003AA7C88D